MNVLFVIYEYLDQCYESDPSDDGWYKYQQTPRNRKEYLWSV